MTAKLLAFSVAGRTDAGRLTQNDDHLLIDADLGLFLVAAREVKLRRAERLAAAEPKDSPVTVDAG